jgi:antitoxin MazE
MVTKVSKWGNSLGVRLPKAIIDNLHLKDGSSVVIEKRDGAIIIVPQEKDIFTVNDLIEGMTSEGVLDQFETYEDVGREIID